MNWLKHESKEMKELIRCYVEQFGFDVIIGLFSGLHLSTYTELLNIHNSSEVRK